MIQSLYSDSIPYAIAPTRGFGDGIKGHKGGLIILFGVAYQSGKMWDADLKTPRKINKISLKKQTDK